MELNEDDIRRKHAEGSFIMPDDEQTPTHEVANGSLPPTLATHSTSLTPNSMMDGPMGVEFRGAQVEGGDGHHRARQLHTGDLAKSKEAKEVANAIEVTSQQGHYAARNDTDPTAMSLSPAGNDPQASHEAGRGSPANTPPPNGDAAADEDQLLSIFEDFRESPMTRGELLEAISVMDKKGDFRNRNPDHTELPYDK